MDTQTDSRLTAIETKLAYLEDFMNQLQAVTVEHTKTIEVLKTENQILSGRLHDLIDSLEEIPNRKPPHY
ncbi:MAG: SlyX family protein [Treponema sp.]|nr:SlyX family protein [Treponema sp.]